MGKNQWVVRHGYGWAVRGEGNNRLTSRHGTQAEAINAGRRIAANQGAELIIQNRHGQIRSKDSYGNDPLPPRDSEH
jgi:hypothetical protein